MIRNYLEVAVRNLWRNKGFSAINIIGLALGLATCLLLLLYVFDDLSYDDYNAKASRIYRLDANIEIGRNQFDMAVQAPVVGPILKKDYPQVDQVVRIKKHPGFLVKKGAENIQEDKVAYADSSLFEVFTLPLITGDAATLLREPLSLVITERAAKKYFNRMDIVGQSLIINDTSTYTIAGVIKNIPQQSHFSFDFFIPMSTLTESRTDNWFNQSFNTYILLKNESDAKWLESQLDTWMNKYMTSSQSSGTKTKDIFIHNSLMPLTKIHLYSNKSGELGTNQNIVYVYIFSGIAVFILLMACVNFMNLSTARSTHRAREVGIRKVLGSLRKNLIGQFLSEAMLTSFIALLLALVIAWLMLPYFNNLSGKKLQLELFFQPRMSMLLLGLMLFTGIMAGSYPAFYLSSFQPIKVLKNKLTNGLQRNWLRSGLVVFQFWISIVLIVATIVIYRQLVFIRDQRLGFNRNQVLVIQKTGALGNNANAFKEALLKLQGVKAATITGYLPVSGKRAYAAIFTSALPDLKKAVSMGAWKVDVDYIPTLQMSIRSGRNFSSDFPSDSNSVIINEAAAKFLETNDPVNKNIYRIKENTTNTMEALPIIGVVKNFNFNSLHDEITPLVLVLGKDNNSIALRINTANVTSLISSIKSKWNNFAARQPFTYTFMDEEFSNLYKSEQRIGKVSGTFSLLAIIIACLGLFGLTAFMSQQRKKEISIRKVLGSSVGEIVTLLSKDFLKLIFISFLIATPTAWYVMYNWLQDFAYRTEVRWWIFATAGIATVLIAFITVSFQAIKAAIRNPVKSLRTE
jgi:putative ABC transport system permease protein